MKSVLPFILALLVCRTAEGTSKPRRVRQVTFAPTSHDARLTSVFSPETGTTTLVPILSNRSTARSARKPISSSSGRPARRRSSSRGRRRDPDEEFVSIELNNGKKLNPNKNTRVHRNPIGQGWVYFKFGSLYQEADHSFQINSKDRYVRLRITDLYLNGDRFAVYDSLGKDSNRPILETPPVNSDPLRKLATDPDDAFKWSNIWSRYEVALAPGKYHLSIWPLSSPYNGGTAAISFDYIDINERTVEAAMQAADKPICRGYGGLIVTRAKVTADKHQTVCEALELDPFDLDSKEEEDVDAIAETLMDCLEPDERAWINTYDGKKYDGRVTAMMTTKNKLKIEKRKPKDRNYVVCQVRE